MQRQKQQAALGTERKRPGLTPPQKESDMQVGAVGEQRMWLSQKEEEGVGLVAHYRLLLPSSFVSL